MAVVIGVVLLLKGYERDDTTQGLDADVTTTLPFATRPTGTVPVGSATSVSLKPPSQVTVIVAKAGAPQGVATAGSEKLKSAGYKSAPKDATITVPASTVYFMPGFQAEAVEVARVFKIPESSVQAMPSPPPEPALTPRDVLVLLGPESRKDV